MKYYRQLFFFFLFLMGGSCLAQERETFDPTDIPVVQTDHPEREADTFQKKFMNMLFVLALLIGFMILASWALKRMMKTKATQLNTGSSIKVLETRFLSPRATLYLVEIENQTLLIAESPTAVTYLQSFPPVNK